MQLETMATILGFPDGRRRPIVAMLSVTQALDEFVAEIIAAEPGATIPVAEIYDLYATTRRQRNKGWPAASQRALVARLASAGCRRKQLDLRSEGLGRPIVYVMPGDLPDVAAA